MKPVRIKIRNAGDISDELIIEDRGGGVDIRHDQDPLMDAATYVSVSIEPTHCQACIETVATTIGLTGDEVEKIVHWRARKQRGWTAAEMGRILDKIVAKLEVDPPCDADHDEQIVLEVEDAYV